jgi:LPS export ABC transporter protein LptC
MTGDTIASHIADDSSRRRTQILLLALSFGVISLLGLVLINLEKNKLEVQVTVEQTDIDQSGQVILEGLTYSGVTRDGTKFRLRAETASENTESPEEVLMTDPWARVETKTGKLMTIKASEGDFFRNRNMIKLKGSVVITRSDGYTLMTDEAIVNLDTGKMTSELPVKGFSPNARVNSNGMIIAEDTREITFTGRTTIILNQSVRAEN